ncbi:hypothetical protein [Spongiimicrobium sp. 3-5]|uniref:hypothetical protein n=1 Tax=Spongiimicrobium sp. 3-5 TaxID=3332596 RepID=UPI003980E27C
MEAGSIFRTILGVLLGELTLIVLTTVAQEVVVDGVHVATSSVSELAIGGIATLIAGLISGLLATLIGGNHNKWPVLVISLFIVIETTYLLWAGLAGNPLWFAVPSALALIASVWAGFYGIGKLKTTTG